MLSMLLKCISKIAEFEVILICIPYQKSSKRAQRALDRYPEKRFRVEPPFTAKKNTI
jgi:hypothetical protein